MSIDHIENTESGLVVRGKLNTLIDQYNSDTGIETVDRTIYVEITGDDITGDGLTIGTAFATIGRALDDILTIVNAKLIIQFGVGDFDWPLENTNKLNHKYISSNSRITFLGTYNIVETGLSCVRGIDEDYFTFSEPVSKGWSEDEHVGRFVSFAASPLVGYPIAKSGDDYVIVPRSWSAGFDIIYELTTNIIVTVKNSLGRFRVDGVGTYKFQHISVLLSETSAIYDIKGGVPGVWTTCSFKLSKLNTVFNLGTDVKGRFNLTCCYVEVNFTTTTDYNAAVKAANGFLKCTVFNNIGTVTGPAYWPGLQIGRVTSQEITDLIVRNVPYAFSLKTDAKIVASDYSGFMALDCGVAVQMYYGGGIFGVSYPNFLIINNTEYLFTSRTTQNVNCLLKQSVKGTPNKGNAVPLAGDTWNGLTLLNNALDPATGIDTENFLFISYP